MLIYAHSRNSPGLPSLKGTVRGNRRSIFVPAEGELTRIKVGKNAHTHMHAHTIFSCLNCQYKDKQVRCSGATPTYCGTVWKYHGSYLLRALPIRWKTFVNFQLRL